MKRTLHMVTGGSVRLLEEMQSALAAGRWIEFKPLFELVHANLRESHSAHGGEEMLRLRAYDQLQQLVHAGHVEKAGRLYRSNPKYLESRLNHRSAQHCADLLAAVARAR
jgi:hypothetical protein